MDNVIPEVTGKRLGLNKLIKGLKKHNSEITTGKWYAKQAISISPAIRELLIADFGWDRIHMAHNYIVTDYELADKTISSPKNNAALMVFIRNNIDEIIEHLETYYKDFHWD